MEPRMTPENAALQRQIDTLRTQTQMMREENAELRKQIVQRDHWIKDLRETVEALLRPAPSEAA
jgi:predicted  nucleic acid-binding Zn-ribbon protein